MHILLALYTYNILTHQGILDQLNMSIPMYPLPFKYMLRVFILQQKTSLYFSMVSDMYLSDDLNIQIEPFFETMLNFIIQK